MSLILHPSPPLEIQFANRQTSPFTIQAIKALSDAVNPKHIDTVEATPAHNIMQDRRLALRLRQPVLRNLEGEVESYAGHSRAGPAKPRRRRGRAGEDVFPYAPLLPKLPAQTLFLHQTHGIAGAAFTNQAQIQQFTNLAQDGDYLITTVPNTALGVLTADCLPVIFYAPDRHAVAAVHAGWRGSVAGILTEVIQAFRALNSDHTQLQVWFGPAAGVCCYAVGPEFSTHLTAAAPLAPTMTTTNYSAHKLNLAPILINRSGQAYFNLARYNYELLLRNGILEHNVDLTCNLCTICNLQFGSYRRDGLAAELQVSRVVLKS